MKKELPYFTVGSSYGGNQNKLKNFVMYFGGCAAVTACDSCVCFAIYNGDKELYPYEIEANKSINENDSDAELQRINYRVDEKEYIKFTGKMKPFLKPRIEGINTLEIYRKGIEAYFASQKNTSRKVRELSGEASYEEARNAVRKQIDAGFLIPCLVLHHKNPALRDYVWHWFLLTGYEERGESFFVKVVTYGSHRSISLKDLWETGFQKKGGLILFE